MGREKGNFSRSYKSKICIYIHTINFNIDGPHMEGCSTGLNKETCGQTMGPVIVFTCLQTSCLVTQGKNITATHFGIYNILNVNTDTMA